MNIRARGIALCDLGLFEAEALRSAGAVVVAGQDIVGLFAETAPVVRSACVVLCLGLEREKGPESGGLVVEILLIGRYGMR